MNKKIVLGHVAAAALALAMAAPAGATLLTETLQNAVFNDGGTATGSFTYDTSSSLITQFSISVAGGNTALFAPVTYDSSIADPSVLGNRFSFVFTDFSRYLNLGTATSLPLAGGVTPLVITGNPGQPGTGESYECINCVPVRAFTSGQLVSAVQQGGHPAPEPATLVLFAFGAAALARSRRRSS
jgi:hypothetical protein